MRKQLATIAALAAGVSCGALLLWLWVRGRDEAREFNRSRAQIAAQTVTPSPRAPAPLDPTTASLLATLQSLLTRSDLRAKEALLTFKDDAALRRFLARAKAAGLTVVGSLDALRSVRVRYENFSALQQDLLDHAADYGAIAGNALVTIPGPPAKEDRANVDAVPFGNRALQFLGVDPASAARATWGQGVTIAVLDTGVTADRTFGTGRLRALDIGLGTTASTGSDDGHGTAVAAVAAGASADAPGVAPAANILSIRVTDATGASDLFTVSQAILAATDAGAKIINVSLGGYATSVVLDNAIAYARDHGAVIVAAAGNDQAAQLTWPAADARVISVGAVDAASQQVSFSNSGPQLSLTAPGLGVQTAWLNGERVYVDGTSISAPLVSGAIAALLSQDASLTPAQAAAVLAQTASDAGPPGDDPDFGRGILNLGWAMNRNNPSYADTAIASHYYDATKQEMDFVVQNRGNTAISGMTLSLNLAAGSGTTGTSNASFLVPMLASGETYVAHLPVDQRTLSAGSMTFTTELKNPPGLIDAVPANNRKSSVLSAPSPTK